MGHQIIYRSYTPANVGGTNWNANAVQTSLGYIPANITGTNWNASAVPTSLGYTPAKIGDSWISFRASYTSGQWSLLAPYTFSSSPDLGNFTIYLPASQTGTDAFSFSIRKNGSPINTVNYNFSLNPRSINRIVSLNMVSGLSVIIGNLDKVIGFNTGGALVWSAAIPTDVDIIVYFSKNL